MNCKLNRNAKSLHAMFVLLILLLVSITSVYGADYGVIRVDDGTIHNFGDPDATVTVSGTTGTILGVNTIGDGSAAIFGGNATLNITKNSTTDGHVVGLFAESGSLISFADNNSTVTLNVTRTGGVGTTNGHAYGVHATGSEIVFSGNATLEINRNSTSAGDAVGLLAESGTAISFTNNADNSNITLNVIRASGAGNGYGINATDGSSITFSGNTNISVNKGTGAGSVYGINAQYGSQISFDKPTVLKVDNTGSGGVYGVYTRDGSQILFNDLARITVSSSGTAITSGVQIFGSGNADKKFIS